jgi:hypothetical protein
MKAFLRIEGHEELERLFAALPGDLVNAAAGLFVAAGTSAAAELRYTYPRGKTGNLIAGVGSQSGGQGMQTWVRVYNTAPHAHLYEYGTDARHTDEGWDRGFQPGRATFWPVVDKWERTATEALRDLLRIAGLKVSDRAA